MKLVLLIVFVNRWNYLKLEIILLLLSLFMGPCTSKNISKKKPNHPLSKL